MMGYNPKISEIAPEKSANEYVREGNKTNTYYKRWSAVMQPRIRYQ